MSTCRSAHLCTVLCTALNAGRSMLSGPSPACSIPSTQDILSSAAMLIGVLCCVLPTGRSTLSGPPLPAVSHPHNPNPDHLEDCMIQGVMRTD
jgi:hypothetical protein